jgi:peptidoglycan/xylan/chitin deacetylase (PgdA/CDA1 family)
MVRSGKQHRWWHKHQNILVLNRAAVTLGLIVLFLGGASAVGATGQVPVSPDEVVQGDPGLPWISLVVNAGAGYEPAVEMLDLLAEKQLRTTFFLMGWWAERNPELVRRIGAAHEVASHGHAVFDLTSVSDHEVAGDLEMADTVIGGLIGRTTRPLWSPSAGYRDARVRSIAASLGYRPIYWTVDSGDWQPGATPEGVASRVLGGATNGAIVVLHFDSQRSRAATAVVLGGLIDTLRGQGFRLVTVSELVSGA